MGRRLSLGVCTLLLVIATACVPPPDGNGSPYACKDTPVSLGAADTIEGISADGDVIVLASWQEDGGTRYDVVDRRRGTRHEVTTTGPLGDGARIFLDEAGTRLYGYRYPALEPGESPWFAHDIATRRTTSWEPPIDATDNVERFSADLSAVVVREWISPGAPYRHVDLSTGVSTELDATAPGWVPEAFSPDLSSVVQRTSSTEATKLLRVLDAATGEVVRDVGGIVNENRFATHVDFVDDRTLLVSNAAPLGAPPDGIDDDNAFVADIGSGAITRIDPGVAGSSVTMSTADGSRSLYAVFREQQTWIRIAPDRAELVGPTFMAAANRDHDVVISVHSRNAWLRCF